MLTASLAVGCTDRSSDGETSDSVGDGDDSSGTGQLSATSGVSDSVGSGDTTSGPVECLPEDPDLGPPVTVRITNTDTIPIYLADTVGCTTVVPFDVLRDGGPVYWQFEECTSCAAAVSGSCGCPAACPIDSVIRLDPGGTWEGSWPGSERMQITLPAGCTDDFCGPQCTNAIASPAGNYEIQLVYSSLVDCGAAQCDCQSEPDPAGWCRVTGTYGGDPGGVIEPFAYPGETLVELTI
jgi:hypothetical protein